MAELHTATLIADADVADTNELPVRLAGTAGLLKITMAKFKAFLLSTIGNIADVDVTTVAPIAGQALVWNGTTSKWEPSSSGGGSLTKIGVVTVTGAVAATVSFTGIPATYSDLVFYARTRGDNVGAVINFSLRFNNDSGGNYDYGLVQQVANAGPGGSTSVGATSMTIGVSSAAGAVNANKFGTTKGEIIQYANPAMEKSCIADSYDNCSNTTATTRWQRYSGDWRSAAAINRIDFIPSAGNWAIGTTFTLYGRS